MGKRLTKIVTRTGDDGTTGLGDGTRIDKSSARIAAIGDIDELNSLLGVLVAAGVADDIAGYLLNIQHRLFDIGGEIAIPGTSKISPEYVERLEDLIDTYNRDLPPLQEFILPGGSMPGAICHSARSVCRRAERSLIKVARTEYINPDTFIYINRLSDLLFVFARILNRKNGDKEVYWNKDRLKHSV
ncbi:MAG: ATP:cob(I)alamin adenosyltransferase [Gammaproteobacteria bacterium RBG_16_51_14]|nr:MAG: ATP:cob(I)alamin adenosyltransferase [Gammaproteobacteria bacterium RBG_16_51_14]